MARRKGSTWTWVVLLVILIGGANMLSRPTPSQPTSSTNVQRSVPTTSLPATDARKGTPTPAPVAAPAPTWARLAAPTVGYVTATNLNVRREPSASGAVLFSVPQGTRIVATATAGGWLGVELNDGSTGWVSADFVSSAPPAAALSETAPQPVGEPAPEPPRPAYDRNAVVQAIIQESIWATGGSCPCPYNTDRGGRRCGGRSAYSRPGGKSPICFPEQVTQAMIDRYLSRNR